MRIARARPRLVGCSLLALLTTLLLLPSLAAHVTTRMIIGWNISALVYLMLAARMIFWSSHERIRGRAGQQDEGIESLRFAFGRLPPPNYDFEEHIHFANLSFL